MNKPENKELAYYLTLFKIEGHSTWRVNLAPNLDHFEQVEMKNWGKNPPVITEKNVIRIDRIEGTIKPL